MLLSEAKKILSEAGFTVLDVVEAFKDPRVRIKKDKFGDYNIFLKKTDELIGIVNFERGLVVVSTKDGNAMYSPKDLNKAVNQFYHNWVE